MVGRRAGHNFALAELNFWFLNMGMVIPPSTYWNMAMGMGKGDVLKDEEGMKTAWNFGKSIASTLTKMRDSAK